MRYLLTAILFLAITFLGQTSKDWGAFTQSIDVKSFAGKRFKLQAAVKVQQIDTSANVSQINIANSFL